MSKLALDVAELTVTSFDTSDGPFAAEAINKCTGCVSTCGILPPE
jgi:hypothetical protein